MNEFDVEDDLSVDDDLFEETGEGLCPSCGAVIGLEITDGCHDEGGCGLAIIDDEEEDDEEEEDEEALDELDFGE